MRRHLLALTIFATISATAAARPAGPPGNQALARGQFAAEMDAEFRRMDADHSGILTRKEIERHQRRRAIERARASNRAMFSQLDSDGNGQLSKPEFARIATPAPVSNAEPLLARMDSNRDAQVSPAEHRAATMANFDRIDRDGDGTVTAAEMKSGGLGPH